MTRQDRRLRSSNTGDSRVASGPGSGPPPHTVCPNPDSEVTTGDSSGNSRPHRRLRSMQTGDSGLDQKRGKLQMAISRVWKLRLTRNQFCWKGDNKRYPTKSENIGYHQERTF